MDVLGFGSCWPIFAFLDAAKPTSLGDGEKWQIFPLIEALASLSTTLIDQYRFSSVEVQTQPMSDLGLIKGYKVGHPPHDSRSIDLSNFLLHNATLDLAVIFDYLSLS